MKSGVILTAAGLAGIAVLVGQMNAGARPGLGAAPVEYDYATSGGIAGGGVPDVAVSRIGLLSSGSADDFFYYGVFNNIHAFSIASTSCNVGSATAQWISGHSGGSAGKHPVIAQNIYRLLNGRFEQIGQSWLKHSFCAVSEFTCGACQPTSCPTLGIGCADTYWATLNGNQNGLGPRSQINPWPAVGVPTHTSYSTPTGNNTIRGRLQIHSDDIKAGGQNFAEILYITHDEPFAQRYNNASWREVNLNLNPISMSGVGAGQASVQFQKSAIMAWRANDPQVNIVNVDVPGDGRFHLGYRVTDNGNGTWHYEYALHNMNSDRSGQSFSVPIPGGVTVTNEGFHDVFYHSGEPYDGTDWPVTVGGGPVSWSTQDFSTNVNANALRWGTMYNYRFDADSPPTSVAVEVGLFKPGTPVSVIGHALGPTEPIANSPDLNGDGCVDSKDLTILLGAWCSAVNDPNPPSPPCENCTQANLDLADIAGAGGGPPDGCVDSNDLTKLLGGWCSVAGGNPCGTCPPPP